MGDFRRTLDVDPCHRRRRKVAAWRQQLVGEQVFEALVAGGEEFHGVRLPDASGGRDIRPDFAGAPPTPRRAGIRITALPAARRTLPPTPPRGRPAAAHSPPRSEERRGG